MQKDLKIGMALGLVLVIAAVLWLSTRPSLSTRARMQRTDNAESNQKSPEQSYLIPDSPSTADLQTPASNQTHLKSQQPVQPKPPEFTARYEYEEIKEQKLHIVRKGETLSDISYKYYGSAGKWKKILEANRKTIKDVNKLIPGTKLIIPQ